MSGRAYLLRCADGSFYTGSTSYDDIDTRVGEHNDGRFEAIRTRDGRSFSFGRNSLAICAMHRTANAGQKAGAGRRKKLWPAEIGMG
jgi:hypothetical protein